MNKNKISFRIEYISEEIIEFNGYSYNKCIIVVPENIKIPAYIYSVAVSSLEVGKYYESKKAYLTREYSDDYKSRVGYVAFRIDSCYEISKDTYDNNKHTYITVNVLVNGNKNNVEVSRKGPMKTPMFCTTGVTKDENSNKFSIMLLSFNGKAFTLAGIKRASYLDISGYLSIKDPERPHGIIVKEIMLRKEVE